MSRPMLVFDMDGVLVDVTESYRETIVRTVQHFTGRDDRARAASRTTRTRAAGTTTGSSRTALVHATLGVDVDYEDVVDYFQAIFLRQRRRRADPARALDGAARPARTAWPSASSWRSSRGRAALGGASSR